ncbi:hypothetical protein C8R43DRAFT_1235808 [Mycena crocata]|nr:hypothetical protein C8R43DRAFT_1235808 [Mycena crocata]
MSDGTVSPPNPVEAAHPQPQAPFDAPDADVILRTSDEVDFRVFKLVLSLASPFFKTMFGIPQASGSSQEAELEVVPATENSGVMDKLLRFCYPCADPIIETLDELHAVIEAMIKYQMYEVVKGAQPQLQSFARKNPVAVFAISCRYEWQDLAKTAARHSLTAHQALLSYHWRCSVAATNVLSSFKWTNDNDWIWFTCQICPPHPSPLSVATRVYGNDTRYVRRWFMDFVERSKAIMNDCPAGSIGRIDLLAHVLKQANGCKNCRDLAFEQLSKFLNDALEPKICEELDKVSLELSF